MTWLDIMVFLIVWISVFIGSWKGFLRTVLKIGAGVFAAVFSGLFGGIIGLVLFPKIIGSDSTLAVNISDASLEKINRTLAETIGIVLLFMIVFIIFRIIAGFIAKVVRRNDKISVIDRVLGAAFGLVISVGIIYTFAFAVNVTAAIITLISPQATLYTAIENSMIFKYFC